MLELVKQEKYTSQKSKSNLNISQKIFPYFTNTRSQDFSQTFYTYEIIRAVTDMSILHFKNVTEYDFLCHK